MSITVIVSLKVADFDDWKAVFDAGAISRDEAGIDAKAYQNIDDPCLLYTSPSPRDRTRSRMPSSA